MFVVPVTRRVKGYTRVVEKYVTGRRKCGHTRFSDGPPVCMNVEISGNIKIEGYSGSTT